MALKLRYLYGSRSLLSVNRNMLRHFSLCKLLKTPLKNILVILLNNALKLIETSLITILQEIYDLSHNSTSNNSLKFSQPKFCWKASKGAFVKF